MIRIHRIYDLNGMLFLASIALLFTANNHAVFRLWHKWSDFSFTGPYGHAPFLVILALWYIYNEYRKNLHVIKPDSGLICNIFLLVSSTGLFLSELISINFLEQFFIYTTLCVLVWRFFSIRFIKAIKYPLLLFFFTLPLWGFLNEPLRFVSLHLSNLLLSVANVPFIREGYFVYLPGGTFEVASLCSGLQQFMVSLILSAIYAYQKDMTIMQAIKTGLYLVIFSLFLNAFRIFVIITLGYYTDMQSPVVKHHFMFGWILYGAGIFLFFWVYERYANLPTRKKTDTREGSDLKEEYNWKDQNLYAIIFVLSIILFPYVGQIIVSGIVGRNEEAAVDILFRNARMQPNVGNQYLKWYQSFPGAQQYLYKSYIQGYRILDVNVSRYVNMEIDQDPINTDNRFYETENWDKIPFSQGEKEYIHLRNVDAKINLLKSVTNQQLLVASWYDVNGKKTSNIIKAKIYVLLGLMHFKYDIKIVSIATGVTVDKALDIDFLIDTYSGLDYQDQK